MKSGDVVANRYRLSARIGAGSMGEVWSATHTATGRDFALKLVHPHVAASAELRVHFARESRASAKIDHPSVVDILDVGELPGGGLYLVMDLLRGITLRDALRGEPRLNLHDFLTVMLDTAHALVAAHTAGVVHRDLKPANIFLHRDRITGLSSAKVLDFGISKFLDEDAGATGTDAFFGSPRYMSPEQIRAPGKVDHRADLWSMGVILFEGLTGTFPHDAPGVVARLAAICGTPPLDIDRVAPDLPESLRSLVRDCLSPIDRRIARTSEFAERLEAVLSEPGLSALLLPRPLEASQGESLPNDGVRVRPPQISSNALGPGARIASLEPGGSTTAAATRAPLQMPRRSSRLALASLLALSAAGAFMVWWRVRLAAPATRDGVAGSAVLLADTSPPPLPPIVALPQIRAADVARPSVTIFAPPVPSASPRVSDPSPLPAPRRPRPAGVASSKPRAPVAPIPDKTANPPAERAHDPFKEM
jgi:serine/threonine protein kinase